MTAINWCRVGVSRMVLKGRLTSMTSKRMLSVWKFSGVPNVTGREIQLHGITDTGPLWRMGARAGASTLEFVGS
jgi:hypothetical protein